MEVKPPPRRRRWNRANTLHAHGGQTKALALIKEAQTYSPRAWRSNLLAAFRLGDRLILSTRMEVKPRDEGFMTTTTHTLHARGGQTEDDSDLRRKLAYSPRAWRSNLHFGVRPVLVSILSTRMEVKPLEIISAEPAGYTLHAHGGQTGYVRAGSSCQPYSPRAWRSNRVPDREPRPRLILSTHMEVKPRSTLPPPQSPDTLHAHGGQTS